VALLNSEDVPLLNQVPRHEDVWVSEVQLQALLTSALDGGEWSTSRPSRFTHRERAPGTHWTAETGTNKS